MKKLLIIIIVIVFGSPLYSQQFYITPKTGVSFSKIKNVDQFSQEGVYELVNMLGFQAGIAGGIDWKYLSFQSELIFTKKGYIKEVYNVSNKEKYNYLELPLLLKASYGMENFKGFIVAGPYFAYCLNGKSIETVEKPTGIYEDENNIDLNSNLTDTISSNPGVIYNYNFSRLDYGLSFGFGIYFKQGAFGGVLEFRYNSGMSDYKKYTINPPDRIKETHQSSAFLGGISYYFNSKKR